MRTGVLSMDRISIQFEKCYLDSIKVVVNHEIKEDIILTFGSFLKQMAANIGGEVRINQISESTPPEVPRAIIVAKETQIQFGLNRVEVEIKGMRKHVKRDTLRDLYKHRIKEVEVLLQSYLNHGDILQGFSGIVAPARFPQSMVNTKDSLLNELHRMCTGRENPNLVTYATTIGLKNDGKFENFEIRDYEVKNINVSAPLVGKSLTINLDDFPTVERGILSVIDVNNKPQAAKFNFTMDFSSIVEAFFKTIETFEKSFTERR
jgi:hypothetical protein